jgi:hypothetical protein
VCGARPAASRVSPGRPPVIHHGARPSGTAQAVASAMLSIVRPFS